MIATNYDVVGPIDTRGGGTDWDDILGRVFGAINGARNPGTVTVQGSTPQVYAPGSDPGAATNYTPLILIALVIVAIVVLSK